ncbi:eukaryotic peptide chain release factor GTP-binding subunit ERF3A-like [Oscarella lobularis]|uniref:eukaryotic peptide chain release factor GTP-binding subunit ERF3A-like n=1 Tax=Oscarella lobularis TaxID=121494 RepID=UPI003314016F
MRFSLRSPMSEVESWESLAEPSTSAASAAEEADPAFSLNVHAKEFVPNFSFGGAATPAPSPEKKSKEVDEPTKEDAQPSKDASKNAPESVSKKSPAQDKETPTKSSDRSAKTGTPVTSAATSATTTTTTTTTTTPASTASSIPIEKGKENLNIIFIGHVDAGKSTIGGHLMYLTGQVDKRTLEKYEKEAKEKNRETWYLSWALDTNLEEREKGKTVEVGRASFDTDTKHFTILDAPGHRSFVPNMISGAQQADIGILVISARKGEFETGFERGGQTREHATLAKTAGVKHLVVLINKMDDPTVVWSQERYDECKTKLTPFLKKIGFNPKTDIYYMPVSGLTGANLKEPLAEGLCPWYTGPPFISYLDSLQSLTRNSEGPLRLPITEKHKDMGVIILGKVESGVLNRAEPLLLMPNKVEVDALQVLFDDTEVQQATSGKTVKVKLRGVEEEDLSPGFVLCPIGAPCHVARRFQAQVVILEHKSIICAGYSAVLHVHACVEEVQFEQLLGLIDKKTGEKSKRRPRFVKQDQICVAQLRTAGVICIEPFHSFPQMGRFTLRDEGKTIAVGKVLELVE